MSEANLVHVDAQPRDARPEDRVAKERLSEEMTGASSASSASHYQLHRNRWVILAIFSFSALLNEWIAYTYAPISRYAEDLYLPSDSESSFSMSMLIDIFFIIYVIFSIPSSYVLEKRGLRFSLLTGSVLQAIGACLRILSIPNDTSYGSYDIAVIGQIVAALGLLLLLFSS